jgi:4-hydroxy-3-polyprenylbenzoate decarboxylase
MIERARRIIVGICGASGVRYGVELLRALGAAGVETHLILSDWGERLLHEEAAGDPAAVRALARAAYGNQELGAPPSSSSFGADAMAIVPATVKTVAAVANADASTLIARAADTMLRLHRPLVIGLRETPLSAPCLENLARLARYGATVLPLSPAFYHRPETLEDLFAFMTGKVLDSLGLPADGYPRWGGTASAGERR